MGNNLQSWVNILVGFLPKGLEKRLSEKAIGNIVEGELDEGPLEESLVHSGTEYKVVIDDLYRVVPEKNYPRGIRHDFGFGLYGSATFYITNEGPKILKMSFDDIRIARGDREWSTNEQYFRPWLDSDDIASKLGGLFQDTLKSREDYINLTTLLRLMNQKVQPLLDYLKPVSRGYQTA